MTGILVGLAAVLGLLDYSQSIQIDTSIRMLENTPFYNELTGLRAHRRLELRLPSFDLKRDYYLLFRYRDSSVVPVWQKILKEHDENDLLKVWYINALSQMGEERYLPLIAAYRNSKNSILRECAANAYSFLACVDSVESLEKWLEQEKNGYVASTIAASIEALKTDGLKPITDYLPQYYTGQPKKVKFFYNVNVESSEDYWFREKDSSGAEAVFGDKFIFPFQQFESRIKYAPRAGTFANRHGDLYHCGQDMGWFMEGLPVHSVANGRVRRISHELSWGCMVAIETAVSSQDTVCVIYGHLSRFINVKVGDEVFMGQKIGQIGNSVSYENGGYWSHLHLGMERASFRDAMLSGYTYEIDRYANPAEFIKRHCFKDQDSAP